MGPTRFESFDPLLTDEDAEAMLRLCERFGSYGMYGEESVEDNFGEGLAQRQDALQNFVTTGGRFGRSEPLLKLAQRTNYFRETYAYDESIVDGIANFLNYEPFCEASRRLYDCGLIRPNIVYANLLIPGQELAVHTDVPEFRGLNRTKDPQWLIVAAHHSGLFEDWRMRIATGVSWFGNPNGGEFVFYPDGPFGPPVALSVRHNTAILLDTDSVFHGVDRVSEIREALPEMLRPGIRLHNLGDGKWNLRDGEQVLANYSWDDLRFSVSWKAYCYADEAERQRVADHSDDLTRDQVVARLTENLRERGRIEGDADDTELAHTIIREFIQYPPPAPDADGSGPGATA